MNGLIAAVGWMLLAMALLGALYTLAAGWSVRWFMSRPSPIADVFPGVSILKPLHGDEPGLRACLEGFCRQDYPGPVQIVFGVRDALDPAIKVVKALLRDHPDIDGHLVIDPRIWGANLKISNLVNMQGALVHPLVVLADSDVSVGPNYLRTLVGEFADPAVGYATCAFVGAPTGNLWSRLSAMAIDHHFLPSVAFGLRIGLAKPCFGPTVAFRREVLDRAGGFARFTDRLADDFEIGRAIRDLGYGFVVPSMLIGHGCPERSGQNLLRHELRWTRTIRLIDPVSYAGSVVCHPLPFALAACLMLHGAGWAWGVLALVLAARLVVVAEVARAAPETAATWWLSPVRDLISAAIHVGGFMARTVEWRGRRFTVGPDGVLTPVAPRRTAPGLEPAAVLEAVAYVPASLAPQPSSAV